MAQYKTIVKLLADDFSSLEAFMSEFRVRRLVSAPRLVDADRPWQMDTQAAAHRLRVGVPATVEHSAEEGLEASKWIAETTQVRPSSAFSRPLLTLRQNFITLMDALKLKLRAKDQLHPLLTDLMTGYSRFPKSQEWQGRPKILHWHVSPFRS